MHIGRFAMQRITSFGDNARLRVLGKTVVTTCTEKTLTLS